jgi:hypothetical protein
MKKELERLIKDLEQVRLRAVNLKARCALRPIEEDVLEDVEMALGWLVKKLDQVKNRQDGLK